MLGFKEPMEGRGFAAILATPIPPQQKLEAPKILFTKIEDEQIDAELNRLRSQSTPVAKAAFDPLKAPVEIGDVQKIDLRIGTIQQAEPVPKSKKLLKLQVDLGFEKRTIVSGISQHYTPEQLIGKKVIVVANLKSAKLMGVESHGMILAGSVGDKLEVITVETLPGGSVVS